MIIVLWRQGSGVASIVIDQLFRIKKIFGPVIQGEGRHAGMPVLFLRFAGCNKWSGLAKHKPSSICSFCDTDFHGGKKLITKDILEKLNELNGNRNPKLDVVMSGGEPTLQITEQLLQALYLDGFKLHLETNGSIKMTGIARYFYHISCSPKQSLEETKLLGCDDLKILYPFINRDITVDTFREYKARRVYLQPIELDGYDSSISKLNRQLTRDFIISYMKDNPTRRLYYSGQLHKTMEME